MNAARWFLIAGLLFAVTLSVVVIVMMRTGPDPQELIDEAGDPGTHPAADLGFLVVATTDEQRARRDVGDGTTRRFHPGNWRAKGSTRGERGRHRRPVKPVDPGDFPPDAGP